HCVSLVLTAASSTALYSYYQYCDLRNLHSFPTRRSSDLGHHVRALPAGVVPGDRHRALRRGWCARHRHQQPAVPPLRRDAVGRRSEEHTSELQSRENLVCRLLLEKKNT